MHGNRILSIFTSLDQQFPIPNLTLNLSCYDVNTGYEGLIQALKRLPESDILSLSLSWKEHNQQLYDLLFKKAKIICVPYSDGTVNPYPSIYDNVIKCSNVIDSRADYSICPVSNWNGNSYAVPAIARLLSYNKQIKNDNNGIKVDQLFKNYNAHILNVKNNEKNNNKILKCSFCLKNLKTKQHTYIKEMPSKCPYCGQKLTDQE